MCPFILLTQTSGFLYTTVAAVTSELWREDICRISFAKFNAKRVLSSFSLSLVEQNVLCVHAYTSLSKSNPLPSTGYTVQFNYALGVFSGVCALTFTLRITINFTAGFSRR